MDRSYLTNKSVIDASRDFVCIRVATYESEEELKFMSGLYQRNGVVENTTFAMLAPDGKTKIARAGRGPMQFRSSSDMARSMKQASEKYKAKSEVDSFPAMQAVDLALNVAACDNVPLLVVIGKDAAEAKAIQKRLVPAIWSEQLQGQFVHCSTATFDDLKPFTGKKLKSGVLMVEPDSYGLTGKILDRCAADSTTEELQKRMLSVVKSFDRNSIGHSNHVNTGIALGIEWKTKLPETDAQSVRATDRARGR